MVQSEHVLVIIQIFIGVVGVVGNATVCLVVRKLASEGGNVNVLIVYQACIDLLTSILLIGTAFTILFPPASAPNNVVLGTMYCIFWHYRVILWSSFTMSTFNLLIITLERYIAVIYPIWYSHHFTRKVATSLIVVAWAVAPLMQLVNGFTQLGYRDSKCFFPDVPRRIVATQGVLLFSWEFLLPCVSMAFGFTRICIKLHQQHRRVGAAGVPSVSSRVVRTSTTTDPSDSTVAPANQVGEISSTTAAEKANRRTTKRHLNVTITLTIVFAVFVVCWSPDQVMFLLKNLGVNLKYREVTHLKSFAIIMGQLNSICNPFIYALRFKQYQNAIKKLFTRSF